MDPIVKLPASALPGEKKYILFAGAGVSKDAGIPAAWDLMLEIASYLYADEHDIVEHDVKDIKTVEEWFINSPHAQESYSKLMEKFYAKHPEQQSFLDKHLGNKKPGQAHERIADLAKQGTIRAIVTTNFDPCIERALEEKELKVQVISTDEDLLNSEPLIHCKSVRIYKPHGTLGRGALRNTPKNLEKLSPRMEKELIKVLGEHGVIVLGYSGRDKGIQKVFRERSYHYYQLFWVDPNPPETEMENILKKKDYTYIPCVGAGKFIADYLELQKKMERLVSAVSLSPNLSDLKNAFASPNEPIVPLYSEYLENIFNDLEKTMPDFSKFNNRDDAIVAQIEEGMRVSYNFIEAALLASGYDNEDVIKKLYEFFGKLLRFQGSPDRDYDGFKFLIYEMFVAFISTLIKYDRWEVIGNILADDLLVERGYEYERVPFVRINTFIKSLDERGSFKLDYQSLVAADIICKRFNQGELSQLVSHKDFMEADYFLYMRTVCHEEQPLINTQGFWYPRACLSLNKVPTYIAKSDSSRFLDDVMRATGFETKEDFVAGLSKGHSVYEELFTLKKSPLHWYDLSKIGSLR